MPSPGTIGVRKPILDRAVGSNVVVESHVAQRVGRFPYFRAVEGATEPITRIEGRSFLNLGSNNYLGLANDPRVVSSAIEAVGQWGAGVTGSRLLNGNLSLHDELEERLARFYGRTGALVFPTGYTANLGLLSALLIPSDLVLIDREVHASIIDGVLLSRAQFRQFRHNSIERFRSRRGLNHDRSSACIIEGIYSMRGDAAPVGEFSTACNELNSVLVVDEAHSLGTIGDRGAGVSERDGVLNQVDIITVTFSKSLGSCGGAVIGDAEVIEGIRLQSRPFLFTASNTPGSLAAAIASLTILDEQPEMVIELRRKAVLMRQLLDARGLSVGASDGPILTISTGTDFKTVQAWKMAWNRGVFCNPVVTPAVPKGEGLLRLSVMRTHSEDELIAAADVLAEVMDCLGTTRWDGSPNGEEAKRRESEELK